MICLDALRKQRNVNTFHQRPLSLTTFHFLLVPSPSPTILSESAAKRRVCEGP